MSETGSVGGGKPYADDDKIFLFLAYFGIFSLIPFFMYRDKRSDPQKEYVYWHSRQGLALALVEIVLSFVVGILMTILALITLGIGGFLAPCVFILFLIPLILGWVKAFQGEKWEMPLVCNLAEVFK